MLSTTIIFALVIVGCHGETCGLFDGEGNLLGDSPHDLGYTGRDVEPGSVLPGELRFENVQPSLETRDCPLEMNAEGNRLWFTTQGNIGEGNVCTLTLTVEKGSGCQSAVPREYTIRYHIQGFVKGGYTFQTTFPAVKGTKLSDEDIEVSGLGFSPRIEFEEGFDGVEIVSAGSSPDGAARFVVRATKLLYLLEDVNLTMTATDGVHTRKASLTIRMTADSAVPFPEFEERLYAVRINVSDLDPSRDVCSTGVIRLKEDYGRLSYDLQPISGSDLKFKLIAEGDTVGVRLAEAPPKNLPSQNVTLLLIARVWNQFGRESEGCTTLLIRLEGKGKCEVVNAPVICDTNNPEDLKMVVIALSVVIVVLIFVIIFLYFKYVCVKKPEPETPCKKCSAPAAVKTRRPTPRKISEYPYPLDVMPPPLETLTETEVEEDGAERPEMKATTPKDDALAVPSTSGVKTRKRSMTFRESDEESRHYREVPPPEEVVVHQTERKISNESQRRISAEEKRRRRSSVKMYRCLT